MLNKHLTSRRYVFDWLNTFLPDTKIGSYSWRYIGSSKQSEAGCCLFLLRILITNVIPHPSSSVPAGKITFEDTATDQENRSVSYFEFPCLYLHIRHVLRIGELIITKDTEHTYEKNYKVYKLLFSPFNSLRT